MWYRTRIGLYGNVYLRSRVQGPVCHIEDVVKHVGPNLVFADDDQHRSRPGRLAKDPAFGLLLSPAGYLTPPVDFVTDGQTDGRTN